MADQAGHCLHLPPEYHVRYSADLTGGSSYLRALSRRPTGRVERTMLRRFPPKKDLRTGLCLFSPCLILLCVVIVNTTLVSIAVSIALLLFLSWIWFGTSYEISEDTVAYRSGPFRGNIPITDIREIQQHTHSLVGNRPVLSSDCLRLRCSEPPTPSRSYSRNYEVFLSPLDDELFISTISEQKPDVAISG